MEEIQVDSSELVFVTAVDKQALTFFVQMCKNPNEELLEFNKSIFDHCKNKEDSGLNEKSLDNLEIGEVCCAKFSEDQNWYRARILSKSENSSECRVLFIDYGNESTVAAHDIVRLDLEEFPLAKRSPFGVTCTFVGFEQSDAQSDLLQESLYQNYMMVKFLEYNPELHRWTVDIPAHGYNIPFWHLFRPEMREKSKGRASTLRTR